MKTFLTSALLLAALAGGAAHAQSTEEIRIPVQGLSRAALDAQIDRAAHRLCDGVAFDIVTRTSADTCIADAVARAKSQVQALVAAGAYATANNQR
jgi:UrcA family protein